MPDTCFLNCCLRTLPLLALLVVVRIACFVVTIVRASIVVVADIGLLVVIADAATRVVVAAPCVVVVVPCVYVSSVATFFACIRSLDSIVSVTFTLL